MWIKSEFIRWYVFTWIFEWTVTETISIYCNILKTEKKKYFQNCYLMMSVSHVIYNWICFLITSRLIIEEIRINGSIIKDGPEARIPCTVWLPLDGASHPWKTKDAINLASTFTVWSVNAISLRSQHVCIISRSQDIVFLR